MAILYSLWLWFKIFDWVISLRNISHMIYYFAVNCIKTSNLINFIKQLVAEKCKINNTLFWTAYLIHLEILCRILVCEPNDLLVWIPDKADYLPATHPLHKLKSTASTGISEVISEIPYKDLKTITKSIIDSSSKK